MHRLCVRGGLPLRGLKPSARAPDSAGDQALHREGKAEDQGERGGDGRRRSAKGTWRAPPHEMPREQDAARKHQLSDLNAKVEPCEGRKSSRGIEGQGAEARGGACSPRTSASMACAKSGGMFRCASRTAHYNRSSGCSLPGLQSGCSQTLAQRRELLAADQFNFAAICSPAMANMPSACAGIHLSTASSNEGRACTSLSQRCKCGLRPSLQIRDRPICSKRRT